MAVDWSVRRQEYVEDCQVCCRPMMLHVIVDDDQQATVEARTDDE